MDKLLKIFEVGGVAMYPLALCSVIMVKIIIESAYNLFSSHRDIEIYLNNDSKTGDKSPYGKIMSMFNKHKESGPDILKANIETARAIEEKKLFRGLSYLATIGVISPFIGLFGTVLGIIRTFESIAKTGKMGTSVISAGVAEALVATAAGLLVAIISVAAYNWLKSLAEGIGEDLEILSLNLYAQNISDSNDGEKPIAQ